MLPTLAGLMPAGRTACIEAGASCLGNRPRRNKSATTKLSERARTVERVEPRVSDVDGTNAGSLRIEPRCSETPPPAARPARRDRKSSPLREGRQRTKKSRQLMYLESETMRWRIIPPSIHHSICIIPSTELKHLASSNVMHPQFLIPPVDVSTSWGARATARRLRCRTSPRTAASRERGAGRPARRLLLVLRAREGGKLGASVGRRRAARRLLIGRYHDHHEIS